MDLKSGYPFWPVKNGLCASFPPLERDVWCDVVVVGGGITGALVAHALADADLDVAVLEKRDAAWGSTAASTAMIQYEIDTELAELAEQYGVERAVTLYRACEEAIGELEDIAKPVRGAGFTRAKSLYLASHLWHRGRVREEGELRRAHGFAVETLEREALRERFGLDAPVALLTAKAAHLDPYRLTLGLLSALEKRGAVVADRTAMVSFETTSRGVSVRTSRDATVHAKHLVLAAGYEAQRHLPIRVAKNRSTYALVSEPLRDPPPWLARTLVWESARPYLYTRATADGRLLMGGEDDAHDVPAKRDALVEKKSGRIVRKVRRLFPRMEIEPSFAWAGTFAETEDGLPFFGPHASLGPRVSFAMAYGGNGIVYSVIGAEIIRARILRKAHPLMRFLSFDRDAP